jgi:hypothetical protein
MKRLLELKSFDTQKIIQSLHDEGRKPDFIRHHIWKYNYLITKIYNRTWRKSHSMDDWHIINSDSFVNALGYMKINGKKKRAHLQIRTDLKKWGLILYHPERYTAEDGSKRTRAKYKIMDEHLYQGWREINHLLPCNWVEKSIQVIELNGVYQLYLQLPWLMQD